MELLRVPTSRTSQPVWQPAADVKFSATQHHSTSKRLIEGYHTVRDFDKVDYIAMCNPHQKVKVPVIN